MITANSDSIASRHNIKPSIEPKEDYYSRGSKSFLFHIIFKNLARKGNNPKKVERRIQNPVKHPRWSVLRNIFTKRPVLVI